MVGLSMDGVEAQIILLMLAILYSKNFSKYIYIYIYIYIYVYIYILPALVPLYVSSTLVSIISCMIWFSAVLNAS